MHVTQEYNITIPASGGANAPGSFVVVKMWGWPQHVGQYHGQKLWNAVYDGLYENCRQVDECVMPQINQHILYDVEYEIQKKKVNFGYNWIGKDGLVYIEPRMQDWPRKKDGGEEIMKALLEAAAYAYKSQTESPKTARRFPWTMVWNPRPPLPGWSICRGGNHGHKKHRSWA